MHCPNTANRAGQGWSGPGLLGLMPIKLKGITVKVGVVMVAGPIMPPGLIVIAGRLSRCLGGNLRNDSRNCSCKLLAELAHGSCGTGHLTAGLILIDLLLFSRGHFGVLRLWVI
jgi:hypothetical protein